MDKLFALPMQFCIPDLLYNEEIEPGTPGLDDLGLLVMEMDGEWVNYAQSLPAQYNHTLPAKNGPKPTHNDYLALAKQEEPSGCMRHHTNDNSLLADFRQNG